MKIYIYDQFNPEDIAMMQALYSRSSKSVTEHVEKVIKTGSGNFMEKFYVGYGHASIADCGSTTIFIEGVSMLVAKAIQDWPLYSGQETSSRYIDMSSQKIVDPLQNKESARILDNWMKFYRESEAPLIEHLKKEFPKKTEEDINIYEKAIKARSFDILRGFLPAGITTQLSWHTNLRQAYDKLSWLKHHPLEEVREVVEQIEYCLKSKYKNSFSHKIYKPQQDYYQLFMKNFSYYTGKKVQNGFRFDTTVRSADINEFMKIIKNRPKKTNLPHILGEFGNISLDCMLDFGSFRDLQRHRNGFCRMPLLSTRFGFEKWYLKSLPKNLEKKAIELIKKQKIAISKLKIDPLIRQYYCAMGYLVNAKVSYPLHAAVYVMELRSGTHVHPTLRKIALALYEFISKKFPKIVLHPDLGKDDFDIRRGLHDIKENI